MTLHWHEVTHSNLFQFVDAKNFSIQSWDLCSENIKLHSRYQEWTIVFFQLSCMPRPPIEFWCQIGMFYSLLNSLDHPFSPDASAESVNCAAWNGGYMPNIYLNLREEIIDTILGLKLRLLYVGWCNLSIAIILFLLYSCLVLTCGVFFVFIVAIRFMYIWLRWVCVSMRYWVFYYYYFVPSSQSPDDHLGIKSLQFYHFMLPGAECHWPKATQMVLCLK